FVSGFMRAAPQCQQHVRPPVLSWGRIPPTKIESWSDEFVWSGTRNPAAYLAVPAAIEFLEGIGLENFRARTHWLARYARRRLVELTGLEPLVPDDASWYGSMAHVPLPPKVEGTLRVPSLASDGTRSVPITSDDEGCPVSNPLQHTIWRRLGIEVPVVEFRGQRYIRVSCHLYNDTAQIERLASGLRELLL